MIIIQKKIDEEVKRIIDQCAERTRAMIIEHEHSIGKLAEALLEKETLDLMDIIDILGHRPFPLAESLTDYLKEIETRKEEAKKRKEVEELKKKEDEEKKQKEEEENKLKESSAESSANKAEEITTLENTEEKVKEKVHKDENKENKKE